MGPRGNFLFDGTHLLYRCAWQVAGRTKAKEPMWGRECVIGFLLSLRSVIFHYGPSSVCVVWDGGRSARRCHLFDGYKAQRPDRSPENHRAKQEDVVTLTGLLRLLGCRVIALPGREGDDLIHLITLKLGGGTVVSDDHDFLQLVARGVSVYRPTTGKYILPGFFAQEFGLPPEQYLLAKALSGDSSDNVHGVPKVGYKTAVKILSQFPGVTTPEGLLAGLMTVVKPTKVQLSVIDSLELLRRNLELFDSTKEMFGDSEMKAVEHALRRGVTFDATILDELIRLELQRVVERFAEWSLPFRRLL